MLGGHLPTLLFHGTITTSCFSTGRPFATKPARLQSPWQAHHRDLPRPLAQPAGKRIDSNMTPTQITPIEPGNRIQLPAEWADALGIHDRVVLDRTAEGILVRPCLPVSWDNLFATKLTIGSAPPEKDDENFEVAGEDLLF
jgi:hypothetical protein